MASLQGFNAAEVEPSESLDVIPAGKYLAVITGSEMKPTKAGTGSYLELTFQIAQGEFQNRLLWTRLNIDNPNATAVDIARRELSAICRAVGVLTPTDSSQLHNIALTIKVSVKRRNDTGEMTNEIKGYEARSQQPKQTQSPPVAGNASAWAQTMG